MRERKPIGSVDLLSCTCRARLCRPSECMWFHRMQNCWNYGLDFRAILFGRFDLLFSLSYLANCFSICLSVCLSILNVYLFVYLSSGPSTYPFIDLSIFRSMNISLTHSLTLSVCLPVCLPACLSVCVYRVNKYQQRYLGSRQFGQDRLCVHVI